MIEDNGRNMDVTLKENEEVIKEKKNVQAQQAEGLKLLKAKLSTVQKDLESYSTKYDQLLVTKGQEEKQRDFVILRRDDFISEKRIKEQNIEGLKLEFKRNLEKINRIRKEIDTQKKEYKKEENDRNNLKNQICEDQMSIEKIKKEINDLKVKIMRFSNNVEGTICERKLLCDKKDVLEKEGHEKNQDLTTLIKELHQHEEELKDLKKKEVFTIKSVKDLTTLRGRIGGLTIRNHGSKGFSCSFPS
jgi:chromosome segregation ATPase